MIKGLIKRILPRGSKGFVLARKISVSLGLTPALPLHEIQYNDWTDRVEPHCWSAFRPLKYEPLISIVVPVFNPPAMHFLPMVYSVVNQTYANWELILINASTNKASRDMTAEAKNIDSRIVIVDLPDNLGIAGNTNAGIQAASGEYIALLDHDDTLAPQALYEVTLTLQDANKPQLIYSDEDKLTNNGQYRVDPHFKPDWSPQLLRELNYINHFSVIEKKLLDSLGGYRSGLDGAQDYDLFLRLVDKTDRITHIPKVLYHWRTTKTSTAENFSQKKNVLDAGVRSLEDHLKRHNQKGTVAPVSNQPGFYQINYEVSDNERVTVLLLPSHIKYEYRKYAYMLLRNLAKLGRPVDVYMQKLDVPIKDINPQLHMHYLDINNRKQFIEAAAKTIDTELCLLVGCAVLLKGSDWLTNLMGLMHQVDDIAVAAPLMLAGDRKTIVDAGVVTTDEGAISLFEGYPDEQHTAFGNSNWVRNVDAASGRLLMVKTKILKANLNLLRADDRNTFPMAFYDQLQESGQQIVIWPFSRVVYLGEMVNQGATGKHFNSHLTVSKTEFNTYEAINVARDYRDE